MRRLSLPPVLLALALLQACGTTPNGKADAGAADSGGMVIQSNGCFSGWEKCAGNCVNLQTSADNCGACGKACVSTNAEPACVAAACTVDTCNTGWADCDNTPQNGCEINLTSDTMNCGACANVCTPANATAACVSSNCAVASCNMGYSDCDQSPINGCEVDTNTDPHNCGGCGRQCNGPDGGVDAGPLCVTGTCVNGTAGGDQ